MKKYSLSISRIFIVTILAMTISSCSRKVGCYYSLGSGMEANRKYDLPSTCLRPSEFVPVKTGITLYVIIDCDQI